MKRAPAVAGSFYPGNAQELREEVERLLGRGTKEQRAYGAVAPHAGYVYSGKVAGEVFGRLAIPSTVVVLNPNHTGAGRPFAVWPEGTWSTPLGEVRVDEALARELIEECPPLVAEERAHMREHSGEVMLPFLQMRRADVSVVVIVVDMTELATLQELGRKIGTVLGRREERPLIIASSDMTHFKSEEAARRQDKLAIEAMVKLDEVELYEVVEGRGITMCGIAPATTAIAAVKQMGARKGELVKYDTSASASGDTSSVVGYAGLIFS